MQRLIDNGLLLQILLFILLDFITDWFSNKPLLYSPVVMLKVTEYIKNNTFLNNLRGFVAPSRSK